MKLNFCRHSGIQKKDSIAEEFAEEREVAPKHYVISRFFYQQFSPELLKQPFKKGLNELRYHQVWISLIAEYGEVFEIKDHSQCFEGFFSSEDIVETEERGTEVLEDALAKPNPVRGAVLLNIFRLAFTHACSIANETVEKRRSSGPKEISCDTSCNLLVVSESEFSILNDVDNCANPKHAGSEQVQKTDSHLSHPKSLKAGNCNESDDRQEPKHLRVSSFLPIGCGESVKFLVGHSGRQIGNKRRLGFV